MPVNIGKREGGTNKRRRLRCSIYVMGNVPLNFDQSTDDAIQNVTLNKKLEEFGKV